MNKLHMLALAGLMFCGVNNTFAMGQEQREILYTLHMLEQDFAQVPMIVQNIDMFMGVMEMNIQLTELKLKAANKEMKTALWQNAVSLTGMAVARSMALIVLNLIDKHKPFTHQILINGLTLSTSTMQLLITLNIYGAWKNRSDLMQAVALDKEILSKLQEIKDSVSSSMIFDDSTSPEKILLENVTQG